VKIWVDCDNSPHVLYLKPFINIAMSNSFEAILTARATKEIVELCNYHELRAVFLGKATAKRKIAKVFNTVKRALVLYRKLKGRGIEFSISSSRSCAIASKLLNIPSFIIVDFEYADMVIYSKAKSYLVVPMVIPVERFRRKHICEDRLIRFDGFKEDFYLSGYSFVEKDLLGLGISWADGPIAVVRPEGGKAHYRTHKTSDVERELFDTFSKRKDVKFIFVPRDKDQYEDLTRTANGLHLDAVILSQAVDGPSLIKHSDLVFTGGGTMAREAAVMGTPSYTYFGGATCGVDEYFIRAGRLKVLRHSEDIHKIKWEKKTLETEKASNKETLVQDIWKRILVGAQRG